MNIKVEIDSSQLKKILLAYLKTQITYPLEEDDIKIEVKSKQNWKSEWEDADYRAVVDKYIFTY